MTDLTDALIGKKIKEFRLTMGMSQEQLAKELGITFQQVQKYERGINRISASRLVKVASVLKKQISSFFAIDEFEKISGEGSLNLSESSKIQDNNGFDTVDSREVLSLIKVYSKIKNHKIRSSIASLAKAMLSQQNDDNKNGDSPSSVL